jgi:hypothetical protein
LWSLHPQSLQVFKRTLTRSQNPLRHRHTIDGGGFDDGGSHVDRASNEYL